MKDLSAFLLVCFGLHLASAQAQDGALDSAFDNDGKVTTDVGFGSYDDANAVVVQPDGRIVAAGTSGYSGTQDFGLVRYMPDGSLDTTFGVGGRVSTSLVPGDDIACALALQPDGKIIAGGYVYGPNGTSFGLSRYLYDGTIDSSFGTAGIVITDLAGGYTAQGRALALQNDGKILLAGGGTGGFAVVRYGTDGSLDMLFGTGGLVTCAFSLGNDLANAIAVQPDDKILVEGYASGLTGDSIALARFDSDGTLDPGFGAGGKVRVTMPTLYTMGTAMALVPDGKIIVGGYSGARAVIGRLNADGTLDGSFNGFGLRSFVISGATSSKTYAVAVQADGKLLLAGSVIGTSSDMLLIRVHPDGTDDISFGVNGVVSTDYAGVLDVAHAIALQADGEIVLAGVTNGGVQDYDFALARYTSTLTTDISGPDRSSDNVSAVPNPLTSNSVLTYTLPCDDIISIDLYDARGKLVRQVVRGQRRAAGAYVDAIDFDMTLPSGAYALVLQGRSWCTTVKVLR